MKPPGYENLAQRRAPGYETNDGISTGQAESRAQGIAFGRPRGAGHTSPAARAAARTRPAATSWHDDVMRMKMRLLELGA